MLKLNQLNGSTQITAMSQVQVRFENDAIRLDSGTVLPVKEISMATRCTMDMLPEGNIELIDYLDPAASWKTP